MVGNTKYYKQVDRATGELIGYISYDSGEAPDNHPTIDYVPITQEEFDAYIRTALEGTESEEGAEADAE